MTIGSFVGVLGVLGLVLGLLILTLRLLKRYAPASGDPTSHVPLEVVQRIALGPRQGIAIVRIDGQLLAVSVGEGGVRTLAEVSGPVARRLNGESADDADPSGVAATVASMHTPVFGNLLRSVLRGTSTMCLLLAAAVSSLSAQQDSSKQAPVARSAPAANGAAATASPATTTAAPTASPAASRVATQSRPAAAQRATPQSSPAAKVDTMLTKLAPRLDLRVGNEQAGGLRLSGTVGVVVMMGLLTLLPMVVLMMTGFTRILIVLHFLRQAIGAQSAPPAQLVAALALLLTGFVMADTLREVNRTAVEPWMDGKIEQTAMLAEGVKPFRAFMLRQTRERDVATFMQMSRQEPVARAEDVPIVVLMSAFVTSELRISFQIGFALFLPFIVIDVVVASVLMSMGMMMLPPAMISLPFKLLLFVLVDGWSLVVQGLVQSFR